MSGRAVTGSPDKSDEYFGFSRLARVVRIRRQRGELEICPFSLERLSDVIGETAQAFTELRFAARFRFSDQPG